MRRHFLKLFIISSVILLSGFSYDVDKGEFQVNTGFFTSLSLFPYESYTFDNVQSINDVSDHDYQFLYYYGFVDDGNKFTIVFQDDAIGSDKIGIINTPNQNINSKGLDIEGELEPILSTTDSYYHSFKWEDNGDKSISSQGRYIALHSFSDSFDPSTSTLLGTFHTKDYVYGDNLHVPASVFMCDKKTVIAFDSSKNTVYNFELGSNYDFSNVVDTKIVNPSVSVADNAKTTYFPSENRVLLGQHNNIHAFELSCDLNTFNKIGDSSYSNHVSTNGGETTYTFYSDGEKFIGRSNEFTDVTDFEVFTIDN